MVLEFIILHGQFGQRGSFARRNLCCESVLMRCVNCKARNYDNFTHDLIKSLTESEADDETSLMLQVSKQNVF